MSRKTNCYVFLGEERSLWYENQLASPSSPRAIAPQSKIVVASRENIRSSSYLQCTILRWSPISRNLLHVSITSGFEDLFPSNHVWAEGSDHLNGAGTGKQQPNMECTTPYL